MIETETILLCIFGPVIAIVLLFVLIIGASLFFIFISDITSDIIAAWTSKRWWANYEKLEKARLDEEVSK